MMPKHCSDNSASRKTLSGKWNGSVIQYAGLATMLCLALVQPARAELQLEDAWVRAVPPVSSGMAGYFTLVNDSAETLVLTGAHAAFAQHIMLHSMQPDANGMRRMKHEDSLTVAPGDTLVLAPGGVHLMIMGLDPVPKAGEQVTVCLDFENRESLCASYEVRLSR